MKKIYLSLVAVATMIGGSACFAQSKAEIRALFEKTHPAPLCEKTAKAKAADVKSKNQEAVTVPFFETFNNSLGGCTIIDANADGVMWEWNNSILANEQGAATLSSTSTEADDWMLTPGIKLYSDRTYTVQFACWASGFYGYVFPENIEVKYGMGNTVADMTLTLMDNTTVDWVYGDSKMVITKTIQPSADGVYYFGFHGCSPTNSWNVFVDDIAIEQEAMLTAPKAVSNLTATAGDNGALSATVSFTLPTEAINGTALTELTKVELLRGEEIINTWTNQQPGATLSFTDNNAKQGNNRYVVKVYNAEGEDGLGKQAMTEVYVGIDVPQRVHAQLSDETGQMVATWTPASSTGANGHYVDPSKVRYIIYEVKSDDEGNMWAEAMDTTGVAVTTYTFDYNPEEGMQESAYYAIAAMNETGRSGIFGFDNKLIKGKTYNTPFNETFANMRGNGSFYDTEYTNPYTNTPVITNDSYDTAANSGSLSWTPAGNESFYFSTGKMTVATCVNPKVKFAAKAKAGSDNQMHLYAVKQGGEQIELSTIDFKEMTGDTVWVSREIEIDQLKEARYFQLRFEFEGYAGAGRIALDDIHVWDNLDNNILVRLRTEEQIMAGKNANIAVSVLNAGSQPVSNYGITITADGEQLLSQTVSETLQAGDYKNFTTQLSTDVFAECGNVEIVAEATYDGDENLEDNVATNNIEIIDPTVNPVKNPAIAEGTNQLSWNKPDDMYETVTEDFERYTPWTVDGKYDNGTAGAWGNWTTYNNDEAYAAGLWSNTQLPHQGEKYAYILVNFNEPYGAGDSYPGRSGYQYLSSFVGLNQSGSSFAPLDNWLISPELPAMEQEITFFIMNENTEEDPFPVTFNIMTSKSNAEISSFQQLGETYEHSIGGRYWIRYNATLPEGTKYFAIQQKETAGQSRWMGIDNITYTTFGSPVASYNIYVEHEKVGTVTAPETSFTLANADTNSNIYVTAVYENGIESRPVLVGSADAIDSLTIANKQSADIYSISGMRVRSNATTTNGLKPGIYVINRQKVVVK